jgi:cyclopropane-fatty-acyl-phospholipid synthase
MFYRRIGAAGQIGLGESYQVGDWDSDDLPTLLTNFVMGIDRLVPPSIRRLRRFSRHRRHVGDTDCIAKARADVEHHYDISNDMFKLFLDETMTYSCALFETWPTGNLAASYRLLAEAQRRKVDRLLDLARVGPGTRVLEIGTGWGELAIRAAQRGAEVHSVTISEAQCALSQRRVARAGVGDRVKVELRDYRTLDHRFCGAQGYDAIVSVEMIEAVGERNWRSYLATLDRLLTQGGLVALQAITIRHDQLIVMRRTHTWLNKYIFPGGQLPSVKAIEDTLSQHTTLRVLDHRMYGEHYAATLRLWRERFASHSLQLERLGFDDVFVRSWTLYLAICEAGFRSRYIDVGQFLLGRTKRIG